MIEVNYNEYKETIAQNMKLIVENHDLKQEIKRLNNKNKQWENKTKILETDRNNWESKFYDEVRKVDDAIYYLNGLKKIKDRFKQYVKFGLDDIEGLLKTLNGEDKE